MKATCYKGSTPVKTFFHVLDIKPNHKYGYFEIYTKIYHHTIIEIMRYKYADTIICIGEDKERIRTYYAINDK